MTSIRNLSFAHILKCSLGRDSTHSEHMPGHTSLAIPQ
ncbi:hypothetical protein CGRA01v4_12806 [Colletotrichum graminicola]|nr:hypothetical protein CGRA01v4_12806 [Colletotrichum graminicola]